MFQVSFLASILTIALGILAVSFYRPDGKLFSTTPEILFKKKAFSDVTYEEVKEYWDRRPCNVGHSGADFGTEEYFNQVEQRKYFVEPHIPKFAEFAIWNKKKVLEIGCGICTEAINFARAGAFVTVVDISPKSIEICRQRFALFGLQAEFYIGNVEYLESTLPSNQKYDLVWSFGSIHHTPNPNKAIHQLGHFISEDGELRMMVYSKVSYKLFFIMREIGIWDFSKMDQIISEYSEAQSGSPVTYTFSMEEVKEMLQNYTLSMLKKTHIFTYKIPEYKRFQYVQEDCWKDVSPKLFEQLEEELGWHTLIAAKPKR